MPASSKSSASTAALTTAEPAIPERLKPGDLIPAIYRGDSAIYLSRHGSGRAFKHGDGSPFEAKTIRVPNRSGKGTTANVVYTLEPGEDLLVPASEVLGVTYLYREDGAPPSFELGAGWCPLPEDAARGLDWSPDLRDAPFTPASGPAETQQFRWVYDYHSGRSDFEPFPGYERFIPVAFRRQPPAAATTAAAAAAAVAAVDTASETATVSSVAPAAPATSDVPLANA